MQTGDGLNAVGTPENGTEVQAWTCIITPPQGTGTGIDSLVVPSPCMDSMDSELVQVFVKRTQARRLNE